jgi:hypothetical protein
MDPNFERRLVRADKLLYQFLPTPTFERVQTSNVESTEDVVNLLRTRSGCRWVAIEVGPNPSTALARRLLREAVERPEFELVRSFPITGERRTHRVDVYRIAIAVNPVATVDLSFPELGNRAFLHVVPITR